MMMTTEDDDDDDDDVTVRITFLFQPFGPCLSECKAAIEQAKRTEPCMKHGDTWDALKWGTLRYNDYGKKFLAALESCWSEIAVDAAMAASNAGQ